MFENASISTVHFIHEDIQWSISTVI